ncbi:hypothetical protein PhCBS80983_g00980 [Powellomyces hirtus]|uniref:Enoyl reductase (ER) domain-containing protein n=1 Tax=Powellomyces hirtus TaxID=109895 RepID=A0A507EEQ3_9FUNG|nr:hypothetical protein PhCBS80983_g00980 [Powellomyces hirtus]
MAASALSTTATTTKVWAVPRTGSLSNLVLQPQPLPAPAAGQVRVAVRAIGLNFADVFCVLGLYTAFQGSLVPGLEFSGVVETDGGDFKKGDRVYGTTRFGAYTTHLNADTRYLRPIPTGWSFAEAAAYPVQTITAYYALKELGVMKPGHTVLVQSAAGGVGLQALRILEAVPDMSVLGVVGNPAKVDFLNKSFPTGSAPRKAWKFISREAGVSFRSQLSTYVAAHEHIRGFDIVLDSVHGPAFQPSYDHLNPCGRYVLFGSASLAPSTISLSPTTLTFYSPMNVVRMLTLAYKFLTRPRLDPMQLVQDNKAIMGYNLIWLYDKLELMSSMYEDLAAMNLRAPHVGHQFAFDKLPDALAFFQTGQSVGKVVITVPEKA